jgi:putative transposase
MPGKAAKVVITERQQEVLRGFTRRPTCPQRLVQRAQMILLAFEGWSNEAVAERLRCERHQVGIWRRRWTKAFKRLVLVECCEEDAKALEEAIAQVLNDAYRSGWAGKFTPEQVAQILAVACEAPEESGRPVSHWTAKELADEVVRREIVASISPRQVGRFLKSGGFEAAFAPVLAQCQSGGRRNFSAASRGSMHVLPGGATAVGGTRSAYRQCR